MHPLYQHIQQIAPINEDAFDKIVKRCKQKQVRKHQFVLQEGQVCTHDTFVVSGALRQYYIDAKGKEHIVQFAFANWWVADYDSMLRQQPGKYNIDALSHSEVLQMDKQAMDELCDEIPALSTYFRRLFQQAFAAQQRRILYLQQPAEERYRDFCDTYKHFEQEVSLAQIASYLGITRESLSRIRRQVSDM